SLKTHPKRLLKVLAAILVFLGMMIGMIYGVRRFFRRKMSTPLSPSVSDDPFADPFLRADKLSRQELTRAAYRTFCAYMWLLGFRKQDEQTEFDFALALEMTGQVDMDAVWLITKHYTRGRYSDMPLSSEELTDMQTALSKIIDDAMQLTKAESRETKMDHYRHDIAQRT
ncbi:MAG TPA: DUF4129 domain-containing protein, partial [Armatimonadota bacterium]|nr:DUF4129 domain-containing protein [Armatimonadota bacterium]